MKLNHPSKAANPSPAHENEEILNHHQQKKYHSMIGSLFYVAIYTRPDILISAEEIARIVNFPTSGYLTLVKPIMHCVAGTIDGH